MRLFIAAIILIVNIVVFLVPNNLSSRGFFARLKDGDIPQDLPKLYPYPIQTDNFKEPPAISARSAIVIDAKTGITLYAKDPNIRHLPASTTKLMTALVALERCSPETIITVQYVSVEGTQMGLSVGDAVTVETLLYGLLINSGNDAAYALAYGCSESLANFVVSMNQKAKELGMVNTHFENPAGFDNSFQYSTASDLAKLAKVAVANPLISKIVITKSTVVTDISRSKMYYLENVNKLLGEVEGLQGIKTGQTEGSLEILVTKTTRNNQTVIVAVLGSNDRFGESQKLIEWTFANHQWLMP